MFEPHQSLANRNGNFPEKGGGLSSRLAWINKSEDALRLYHKCVEVVYQQALGVLHDINYQRKRFEFSWQRSPIYQVHRYSPRLSLQLPEHKSHHTSIDKRPWFDLITSSFPRTEPELAKKNKTEGSTSYTRCILRGCGFFPDPPEKEAEQQRQNFTPATRWRLRCLAKRCGGLCLALWWGRTWWWLCLWNSAVKMVVL